MQPRLFTVTHTVPVLYPSDVRRKLFFILKQYLVNFIPLLLHLAVMSVVFSVTGFLSLVTFGLAGLIVGGPATALLVIGLRNVIVAGSPNYKECHRKIKENLFSIAILPLFCGGALAMCAFMYFPFISDLISSYVAYVFSFAIFFAALYENDGSDAFRNTQRHSIGNIHALYIGNIATFIVLYWVAYYVLKLTGITESIGLIFPVAYLIYYALISFVLFHVPLAYCLILEDEAGIGPNFERAPEPAPMYQHGVPVGYAPTDSAPTFASSYDDFQDDEEEEEAYLYNRQSTFREDLPKDFEEDNRPLVGFPRDLIENAAPAQEAPPHARQSTFREDLPKDFEEDDRPIVGFPRNVIEDAKQSHQRASVSLEDDRPLVGFPSNVIEDAKQVQQRRAPISLDD